MSRDPEDGNSKDPASLHKYLYAGGDPVNVIDPMGREAMIEFRLILHDLIKPAAVGLMIAADVVCAELAVVAGVLGGIHYFNAAKQAFPWPATLPCLAYGTGKVAYASVIALIAML